MQPRRPRELRIIAGRWRGRRLRFPAGSPIRPTPDRVRETLFNWLSGHLQGAALLDVFAGSGALGLEALSRGAATALFLDEDGAAIAALRERFAEWGASGASALRTEALGWLARGRPADQSAFDLAFVDPPFAAGLLESACERLEAGDWLAPGAFVYVERPRKAAMPRMPPGWEPFRAGFAGEVGYHLLRRTVRSPQG
jgi:16S rRNA (guanine966-N2)-methyltransferase